MSSSTTTSSPSIMNVLVPEVKSIDLHVIFPVVVTVPPVLVVFKVMSASLNAHTSCPPALSKVTLLALPAIKLPEDLVISFLGYIVFPFKSNGERITVAFNTKDRNGD